MKRGTKPALDFKPLTKRREDEGGFVRLSGYLPRDEAFSTQDVDGWQYHWNVSEARRWAEGHTHLLRFRPADYGITMDLVREQYPDMDAAYAMTTDLSRPLLLALFRRQEAQDGESDGLQLLDGWHRLCKALLTGVEWLPTYLLARKQAETFLFAKLPPGKSIEWDKSRRK